MRLILPLAFALAASTAAEAVTYEISFERSGDLLFVIPEAGPTAATGPYEASIVSGDDELLFQLGFTIDGPLDGLTVDIANLGAVSADAHALWLAGDHSVPAGTVRFDGGGVIEWSITADDAPLASSDFFLEALSEGEPIDRMAAFWNEVINPDILPALHYGHNEAEPEVHWFALAPGRWSCSADGRPCDGPTVIPIPPSGALMLLLMLLSWPMRLLAIKREA